MAAVHLGGSVLPSLLRSHRLRGFNVAAVLHGGSVARPGLGMTRADVFRFNVAAVLHGGSEQEQKMYADVAAALQRGRRSSRRIGAMQTPAINAGWCSLQRGRRSSRRIGSTLGDDASGTSLSFNVAAVHLGGPAA
ncbi:hypothetical protein [Pendulispora rubella]|uniref:hypothetical protein n=1 Tax=Pendulispora rubella TaxID=2741070 RepID=UPI0038B2F72E